MKYGTISFKNKIYNLDYMNSEDIIKLQDCIDLEIEENFKIGETIIKDNL